ncbi:MAG: hypothetical protein QXW26_04700 [Candidatus Nitrosocaldus sp.]
MAVVAALPPALPSDLQFSSSSSTTTHTIAKRTGHRRTLLDVFVNATSSGFFDIKVGNATLLRIYDNLAQAKFLAGLDYKHEEYGFLWYLSKIIPDFPFFTAAQDEDIVITRNASASLISAYWKDQVEGDVTARNLAGGSQGNKHLFIMNVSNSTPITTSESYLFDRFDMPSGLSIMTDTKRVSANNRFTVYALAANVPKSGSSKTTRVHIFDEQIELFTSENNEGLLVDPDVNNMLEFSLSPIKLFKLPTPYIIQPNRLLIMKGDALHDGTNNLPAGSQQLFLIGVREFVT